MPPAHIHGVVSQQPEDGCNGPTNGHQQTLEVANRNLSPGQELGDTAEKNNIQRKEANEGKSPFLLATDKSCRFDEDNSWMKTGKELVSGTSYHRKESFN